MGIPILVRKHWYIEKGSWWEHMGSWNLVYIHSTYGLFHCQTISQEVLEIWLNMIKMHFYNYSLIPLGQWVNKDYLQMCCSLTLLQSIHFMYEKIQWHFPFCAGNQGVFWSVQDHTPFLNQRSNQSEIQKMFITINSIFVCESPEQREKLNNMTKLNNTQIVILLIKLS